jgi:hypothetical protein
MSKEVTLAEIEEAAMTVGNTAAHAARYPDLLKRASPEVAEAAAKSMAARNNWSIELSRSIIQGLRATPQGEIYAMCRTYPVIQAKLRGEDLTRKPRKTRNHGNFAENSRAKQKK